MQSGQLYFIKNKQSGLNVTTGSTVLQTNGIGDNVKWEFIASGNSYHIKNKQSGLFLINSVGVASVKSTPELWAIETLSSPAGHVQIKHVGTGKYLKSNNSSPDLNGLLVADKLTTDFGIWKLEGLVNNNFTMLFMADPQYPWIKNMSESDDIIKTKSKMFMAEQVESMNQYIQQNPNMVKGVIANGDMTAFGRKEEMDVTMSKYKNLTVPMYIGLGNHDYSNCVDDTPNNASASYMVKFIVDHVNPKIKTGFDYLKTGNNNSGSLSYSWDINNIHFVQLHNFPAYEYSWTGTPPGGTQQTYDIKAAFNWLEMDLSNARKAGKGIILNMHDLAGFREATYPTAYNRLKTMVDKYQVAAVFVGHIHGNFGMWQSKIGNTPIFYCGAPFYENYLAVEFKYDKMNVHKVRFSSDLGSNVSSMLTELAYTDVPIPTDSKTLNVTSHPVSSCTAYSPNNDGQIVEFTNQGAFQIRANVSYFDANKEMQNWYGEANSGGNLKAWLPQNATNIWVYLYAKTSTGFQKKFYSLYLDEERSACFKTKGTYDSPQAELCGNIPSHVGFLKFKNKGSYAAIYEVGYSYNEGNNSGVIATDDVLVGQERIVHVSGIPKTIKLKIKSSNITKTIDWGSINSCYESGGALGTVTFDKAECGNPVIGENYIQFKNTGAYSAIYTVTANGTTYSSGDVISGKDKTIYFDGPATNLTAKVVAGPQIADVKDPGMNTCYKTSGILTSPQFSQGCGDTGENYIRFKNTGGYIAVFTVTANGITYQSGDVLAGQEKTINFNGAASNLTAKVKSGQHITSINGPGMNTCYKTWGLLPNPKFAQGCN